RGRMAKPRLRVCGPPNRPDGQRESRKRGHQSDWRMQVNRRSLYRCRHDKRLAGVASGIAEYFDLDVSLVRVLWVLSVFVGGMGLFLYVALAIIVPLEPEFVPQGGVAAG